MASPVQPLDFESIISYAIGDANLFVYIGVIVLSIIAAKVRMPMRAYFMMMFVFILIMYFTLGTTVAIIISIIAAIIIGSIIARIAKQ